MLNLTYISHHVGHSVHNEGICLPERESRVELLPDGVSVPELVGVAHYEHTAGSGGGEIAAVTKPESVWSISMSRTVPRSCYGVSYAIKNQLLASKAPY